MSGEHIEFKSYLYYDDIYSADMLGPVGRAITAVGLSLTANPRQIIRILDAIELLEQHAPLDWVANFHDLQPAQLDLIHRSFLSGKLSIEKVLRECPTDPRPPAHGGRPNSKHQR